MRKILLVGVLVSLLVPALVSAQGAPCPAAMSLGSRGPNVIRVQQILNKAYQEFATDLITGYFGKLTEAAVKQWQKDNGVVSSGTPATTGWGVVGPRTSRAMGLCGGASTPVPPPTPATQGACILGNVLVVHGSSVTRFQSPVVQTGSSCIAQSRVCTNGVLSGTFTHLACTVEAPLAPPAAPAACTPPTRDLRLGDEDASTGGQVSVLQRFLARDSAIYPEGLITGFYGPASERAVVRFQKANNISPTGYVGPVTRTAMKAKCEGKPLPNPDPASFKATPTSGNAPLKVDFVATGFERQADVIYVIDFGDDSRATMVVGPATLTAAHTYTKGGAFKVRLLQVENLCGGVSTNYGCVKELQVDGVTVTVEAPQLIDEGGITPPGEEGTPQAGGGGGVSGDLGCVDTPRHPADAATQCFTLSGRTLTIRPGGTVGGPLYFNTLKWGDGAEEAWYNTVLATHTYASAGTFTVALPYMFQVNVNSGSIFEPRTVTKTFTISN